MVHLQHLRSNLRYLKSLVPIDSFFCPMLKANAYGHGDIEIARVLEQEGVSALGVCLVEEGLRLREAGLQLPILLFGSFSKSSVKELLHFRLTPVVSYESQLQDLEDCIQDSTSISIHLKFDTGMHRLGFLPHQAKALAGRLYEHPNLRVAGLLTHLHSGHDLGDPAGSSAGQLAKMDEVCAAFASYPPLALHALNSSGLLASLGTHQKYHEHWGARPGLSLYGVDPLVEAAASGSSEVSSPLLSTAMPSKRLYQVLSLRSHIVRLHELQAGDSVSYSATWRAKVPSTIAVLPVGYADGVHRLLSNRGEVLVRGERVPIVGNVCMDFLMIDVTRLVSAAKQQVGSASFRSRPASVLEGEVVTLLGWDPSGAFLGAQEVAGWANTISWEVLTSISERVPRMMDADVGFASSSV